MAILASGVDTRTLSPDQQAALGRINGGKPIPLQPGQTMQGMAEANRLFPGDPGYTQTKTPFYTAEQSAAEIGRNAGMGQPTSQEYFSSITPAAQQSFLSGFRSSYNGGTIDSPDLVNAQEPDTMGNLRSMINQWNSGYTQDSNFLSGLAGYDKNNNDLVLFGGGGQGGNLFGQAPEVPNFQQDYKDTLQALGYEQSNRDLGAVESQINSIRGTLSQLQDTYQNYINDMEGKGGFENIVAGRQARLNTEYQRRAQPLIRALDSLVQQQENIQNRQKQMREDVLTQIGLAQENTKLAMQLYEGKKGDAKWAIEQSQKELARQAEEARNGRLEQQKLLETLLKIPKGLEVELENPDGTMSTYTGIGTESGDFSITTEKVRNADGTETLKAIIYDKNSGTFRIEDLGVSTPENDALSPANIQSTINQLRTQFKSEPIVVNYNVIAEGYQTAQSLANKAKPTSADNIAMLYAFAKAMDPNSVVREGEYATVQKYAQSWLETFGFNSQRLLTNKEFLTKEATRNMVNAIKTKYDSSYKNYLNVQSEYNRMIEDAKSGIPGGSLVNYDDAYGSTEPASLDSMISDLGFQPRGSSTTGTLYYDPATKQTKPFTDEQIQQLYEQQSGFNGDLSMSQNGSRKVGYLSNYGQVTGYGSPYWKHGLDVDLKKGDPVTAPVNGRVVYAGNNGGFGNQVKIQTDDGHEIWLSHLDQINVKKGQRISQGVVVGKGGNTGKVIKGKGGDGSHLDITIKKGGKYLKPQEVKQYFG